MMMKSKSQKTTSRLDRLQEIGQDFRHDVRDAGRNVWFAGLGALATVDEYGRDVFGSLVEHGEKRAKEERAQVKARIERTEKQVSSLRTRLERRLEERTSAVLKRFGVPTRKEVQTLIRRIEQLTRKVEALS